MKKEDKNLLVVCAITVILFFVLGYFNIDGNITGKFILGSSCHDSDRGRNKFVKGTVTMTNWGDIRTFDDKCIDDAFMVNQYY